MRFLHHQFYIIGNQIVFNLAKALDIGFGFLHWQILLHESKIARAHSIVFGFLPHQFFLHGCSYCSFATFLATVLASLALVTGPYLFSSPPAMSSI